MTRRFVVLALIAIAFPAALAVPLGAFATEIGPTTGPNVQLVNPLGSGASSLPALVSEIMQFVVRIGAIVVIFRLVYTGYLFVTARGNPGEIGKAKENLKWVVIGALVLLGAQAIALGIQATVQALSVGS